MSADTRTWHRGLVAEWWARFNLDGPEIEEYGRYVAEGQPALDAGCGTGRLLVPWLAAGYDIDGCDASEDMLRLCRERALREGFEPTLWATPLHELEPPRRYRTIVCCGTFGLGGTRGQDEEALRRFLAALEPGGRLILDHELLPTERFDAPSPLPEPWSEGGDRDRADDGSTYELRGRRVRVDREDRTEEFEIRVRKWDAGGEPAGEETHGLTMRSYGREELRLLLERTGFARVDARDGEPGFAVYVAVA